MNGNTFDVEIDSKKRIFSRVTRQREKERDGAGERDGKLETHVLTYNNFAKWCVTLS